MTVSTPTFAIVGAVNHGKSSVVATLAEDDSVRISAMPGETVECQRFWLLDLFVFYDTPGFQNALEALPELTAAAQAAEPLAIFREFTARHRGESDFEAECMLFRPILEGAGVVYVVDGSEPVLPIHVAEMEILRLTGQPRLAIINRTSSDDHVAEWKRRLGLHFNAVREFNAHHARFSDRLELLETLASIEQTWKPKLRQAVQIFREEWEKRLGECAEIIAEMLVRILTHRETALADADSATRRAALGEELRARFTAAVSALEARAHGEIIRLFGHHRVRPGTSTEALLNRNLFSDETWRAFGLDEKQLVAAGLISGAAAGAAVDLATVGHSIGIPTLFGAGLGGLTAFALGRRRPELKVEMPWLLKPVQLGGSALTVGPYAALNFPWILLDRALGTFLYVAHRAHARRDEVTIDTQALKTELESAGLAAAQWDESTRKIAERLFARIRKNRLTSEERAALTQLIRKRLRAASAA